MTPSLTRRLIWTLIAGAVALWLLSAGLAVTSLRGQLNAAFDSGLQETAERLLPLALDGLGEVGDGDSDGDHAIPLYDEAGKEYLVYQVRLASGTIVLRSHDAPSAPLAAPLAPGFVDAPPWRVFTLATSDGSAFIQAAEPIAHRTDTLLGAIVALILPIAIFVPLAIAGIALAVRSGLKPVRAFAERVGARQTSNLSPVGDAGLPSELKPIARAVDDLILRVSAALESERAFAANSAHELRTPIAGSLAQTQRLIAELDGQPSQPRARQIETGLQRLAQLAEKLLQLSRADAGIARASGPIDLGPAVNLVVGDIRRGMTDPDRLKLTVEAPPQAAIDLDAFGIALRNLVDNALRHGDPNSEVAVVARSGSITVNNGGPLISPERLATLTQRFVRGASTASGTGLGLAIVETIMQQSGGKLHIASPAPGRNDGFSATLVFGV